MELEGSLLHSQEPTVCQYPRPAQSSPCSNSTSWRCIYNIILPPTSRSFKQSLYLRFSHQNPVRKSPHACYMPLPSHSTWFPLKIKLKIFLWVGNWRFVARWASASVSKDLSAFIFRTKQGEGFRMSRNFGTSRKSKQNHNPEDLSLQQQNFEYLRSRIH